MICIRYTVNDISGAMLIIEYLVWCKWDIVWCDSMLNIFCVILIIRFLLYRNYTIIKRAKYDNSCLYIRYTKHTHSFYQCKLCNKMYMIMLSNGCYTIFSELTFFSGALLPEPSFSKAPHFFWLRPFLVEPHKLVVSVKM